MGVIDSKPNDSQINTQDCTPNFSFEKERVKSIEHTILFSKLIQPLPNQDSVVATVNISNLLEIIRAKSENPTKKYKRRIADMLEKFCFFFSILLTVNVAISIFSPITVFPREEELRSFLPIPIIDILLSFSFIRISVKIISIIDFSIKIINKLLKETIFFFILLLVFMIYIGIKENIIKAGMTLIKDNIDSIIFDKYLTVVLLTFSGFYKSVMLLIYIVMSALIKKASLTMEEQKQLQGNS